MIAVAPAHSPHHPQFPTQLSSWRRHWYIIYVLKCFLGSLYILGIALSLSSSLSLYIAFLLLQKKNPQKSTNLLPNCILQSSYLLSLPRRARGHFSTAIALPIEFNIQWIPFATYMRRILTWIGLISNCPNWSPSTSIPYVLWAKTVMYVHCLHTFWMVNQR